MSWFGRKNRGLGIDIAGSAVRLVEISRNKSGYTLESCAYSPLPYSATADRSTDILAASIRQAVAQSGSKLKQACTAISNQAAISRTITIPSNLSDEQIQEQVWLQASEYMPYPLDQISLDYAQQNTTGDSCEVLVVASNKSDVANREKALQQAGITATVIDVEMFAMENAYPLLNLPTTSDSVVAVVEVEALNLGFNILQQGKVIHSKKYDFSQLDAAPEHHYDLFYHPTKHANFDFDAYKIAFTECLDTALESFARLGGKAIASLVLAGSGASAPKLQELLAAKINLPVTVANPFAQMATQQQPQQAPAMLIASGLALRSLPK